ncbi:MAG: hypothetical protein RL708_2505 [Bacteroidota bacterium]|jgi:hypothetical protein
MLHFIFILLSWWFALMPAKNDNQLCIDFVPMVDTTALQLGNKIYCMNGKDSFRISELKCYVGNFEFESAEKKLSILDNRYFLLNAEDSISLHRDFNLQQISIIRSIDFTIGIDSLTNVSGAMADDLDPTKGMFWAWNTGYINAKLSGSSNSCKTVHHAFEFHIGGYKHPFNTLRKIHLELVQPIVFVKWQGHLKIKMNIAEWLKNIDVSKMNNVVEPSVDAMFVADNYSKMFSIVYE